MSNEEFEKQWAFVVHHHEPHVRRIAQRGGGADTSRAVSLRKPAQSPLQYDERLSIRSPPYVLTNEFEERYEARDFDNRPIVVGSLDVAVAAVVRAMANGFVSATGWLFAT